MHDPAMALVTVVIPCFNQARFLAHAIASVRRQTYPSVELLVVDDGSTDETAALAIGHGVNLVRQPNRGVSEARNAGLAHARGELVVFLDADDQLLDDAVYNGVVLLASHPDKACAVGRCTAMDADGRAVPSVHAVVEPSQLYRTWLSRNFVWTPAAAIFRRHALSAIGGFPEALGPAADYAVYLALARTGGVIYQPRDVARYRQHDGSMSRDPLLMLRATLAVLRREAAMVPRAYADDLRRGRRSWRDWYGEQAVHRLRHDWHQGRRGLAQLHAAAILLWHCPRTVWRHARQYAANARRRQPRRGVRMRQEPL